MHYGINPYLYTPADIHLSDSGNGFLPQTYEGLNSKNYFTVYPPVAQILFYLSSYGTEKQFVIILRLLIIISELLLISLLYKWLTKLNVSKFNLYLFFVFNPFVVLEFTCNLHLESITILFMLLALYYLLEKNNSITSSIFLSLAICLKLVPAISLLFILKRLGFKSALIYTTYVLFFSLVMFIPFNLPHITENFASSVDLFIRKFEFNAGIYYFLNTITSAITGFNTISYLSPLLVALSFVITLYLVIKTDCKNTLIFLKNTSLSLVVYYLFSSTVHPWYLSVPMCLAILTNYKPALIWPFLAMLSYSFYGNSGLYYYLIAAEYILLLIVLYKQNRNYAINLC